MIETALNKRKKTYPESTHISVQVKFITYFLMGLLSLIKQSFQFDTEQAQLYKRLWTLLRRHFSQVRTLASEQFCSNQLIGGGGSARVASDHEVN